MYIPLADDCRQRTADVVAVTVLARFILREVEPDLSQLGMLVATAITNIRPEELRTYSAMDWRQAARQIKIAFVKDYLVNAKDGDGQTATRAARRAARPGRARPRPPHLPPPAVDEWISHCIVAALYKFVSLREITPDWYAPHLEQVP